MSLDSSYKPFELTGSAYYQMAGVNVPQTVEIRHLTIKEIKFFSQLSQSGSIDSFIDGLIQSCCRTKFDINQLLTQDRIYLFYMLRALTISNLYGFSVTCEDCGKTIEMDADLFTLDKKMYDQSLGYPLKLALKHSGKTVEFVLPNRGIEKAVEQEVKKFRLDFPNGEPPEAVYQIRKLLKSVDGDSALGTIIAFSEEMHISDWVELDRYITKVSPGLDLNVTVPCSHCGHENKEMFSVRPDQFFRFSDT